MAFCISNGYFFRGLSGSGPLSPYEVDAGPGNPSSAPCSRKPENPWRLKPLRRDTPWNPLQPSSRDPVGLARATSQGRKSSKKSHSLSSFFSDLIAFYKLHGQMVIYHKSIKDRQDPAAKILITFLSFFFHFDNWALNSRHTHIKIIVIKKRTLNKREKAVSHHKKWE